MGFWPGLGRPLHRLLRAGAPPAAPTSPLLSEVLTRGRGSARSFLVVHKLGRSEHASLSPGFPAPEAAAQAPHALPAGLTLHPRTPVPGGAGGLGACPAQTGAKQADGTCAREAEGWRLPLLCPSRGTPSALLHLQPLLWPVSVQEREGGASGGLWAREWGAGADGPRIPVALGVPGARIGRAPRREGWRGKEGGGVRATASQAF